VSEERGARHLGRTILSLLVAVDQRCPAIIGQAHVLYHACLHASPNDLTKMFAQLKREADDLGGAIKQVEDAMKNTR
jgi:hypothetical protein